MSRVLIASAFLILAAPALAQPLDHVAHDRATIGAMRVGEPEGAWRQTIIATDNEPDRPIAYWLRRTFVDPVISLPTTGLWMGLRVTCNLHAPGSRLWSYCGSFEAETRGQDGQAVGLNVVARQVGQGSGIVTALHVQATDVTGLPAEGRGGVIAAETGVLAHGPEDPSHPIGKRQGWRVVAKSYCGSNAHGTRPNVGGGDPRCETVEMAQTEVGVGYVAMINSQYHADMGVGFLAWDGEGLPRNGVRVGFQCRNRGVCLDTQGRDVVLDEAGTTLAGELAALSARIAALESMEP